MDILTERGAEVAYFDPYVRVLRRSQHPDSKEIKSVNWDRQTVSSFDLELTPQRTLMLIARSRESGRSAS